MKVSNDFVLREIAGEYLLIPVGVAATRFNGMITLNEVAGMLFRTLETEHTLEELTDAVTAEFDVDRDTAKEDIDDFLQQLRELGALLE